MAKPSYIDFDHVKFQKALQTRYDFRGEIGVLSYPFSKKISKIWRFATPDVAKQSAAKIRSVFLEMLAEAKDFVAKYKVTGNKRSLEAAIYRFLRADICRKFIMMGWTRSMRYANHRGGKKWEQKNGEWKIKPLEIDPVKLKSAAIFREVLDELPMNSYNKMKKFYQNHIGKIMFCSDRI